MRNISNTKFQKLGIQPRILGLILNLPANLAAVPYRFGKFKKQIKRGTFFNVPMTNYKFINTAQQSVVIGFYGAAGRYTPIYLNWLLKAFQNQIC